MAEIITSQGETFDFAVLGGDRLFPLIPRLNQLFSLELNEDDYVDAIAHISVDDKIVLLAYNTLGDLIYTFKNTTYDQSKVISQWVTPNYLVCKEANTIVNFKEELDFLSGYEVNSPILYTHQTAPDYRKLKSLLFRYGYGDYMIANDKLELSGLTINFFGKGSDLTETRPELSGYERVAILALLDGEVVLKTEN